MNFKEMNEITYEYYQWPMSDGRNKLFDLNKKTTGFEDRHCITLCGSDCYKITVAENLLFSGLTHMTLQEMYQYFNDNLFFTWDNDKYKHQPGNYQQLGTSDIYKQMEKDGLIDEYSLIDCDYGKWAGYKKVYSPEARCKAWGELMAEMMKSGFVSARVCFDNGSTYGHAMMVSVDDNGNFVVIDNSTRPHEWPKNKLSDHVNKNNIKWFTIIK